MSSIVGTHLTQLPSSTGGDPVDPFRYGWRYVPGTSEDGTAEEVKMPLTLEDILHPEEEDFRVHTIGHNEDCAYLREALESRFPKEKVVVMSGCRVDWGVLGIRPHGPDVAVIAFETIPDGVEILGTIRLQDWPGMPLLVIEVTSPSTRSTDLEKKVDHYFRAGIKQYVIVDVGNKEGARSLRLINYKPGEDQYEDAGLDDHGRVFLEAANVWLGVQDNHTICIDAETGEPILNYMGLMKARQAAEEQSKEDAEARQAAEERIRQLEARLSELENK
jgi:Uma2 family endonuclease